MSGTATTGGISVQGTTPDPKTITLSDSDYINYLQLEALITAINKLSDSIRGMNG